MKLRTAHTFDEPKKHTPFFSPEKTPSEPFFQPKLKVNSPGDQLEKEADTVADRVVEGEHVPEQATETTNTHAVQRSLAGMTQPVRDRTQLWNVRLDSAHTGQAPLNDLFKKDPPNTSLGFGGTKVLDPSVITTTAADKQATYDVARGIDSIPGLFVSRFNMPINTTATVHLDFSPFGGQAGTFRVSYINSNMIEGDVVREFHLEYVGGAHATAAQSTRPDGITIGSNSFTADGWPDAQYDQLIETLNRIPASALNQINGMTFNYRGGTAIAHGQAMEEEGEAELEYGVPTTDRVITVFSSAVAPNAMNYEGLPRIAFVIAHEIGHWLDFMPIFNTAAAATGPTVAQTDSLSGYTRMETDGELVEDPSNPRGTFHGLNTSNTDISAYGASNAEESFAEYFAMYITSPNTLLLMRPTVHAYFARQFP